jgi:hypothetical protein
MSQPAGQKTNVLITVMTYPHPSVSHQELVCTAGISDQHEWVRLYPIDYRYRPDDQQFHKYQWVEVELAPRGDGNDKRKESRKPNLDTLKVLGPPLSTGNDWLERRTIIDAMPHHTVNQLKAMHDLNGTSLGIVRPARVLDLVIEPADREWKPEWQMMFQQLTLFGPPQKPLAKLPYKWKYVFECEDNPTPHSGMIEDWELGVLFLKLREEMEERAAAEKVKEKYLNVLCAPTRDTRFFMGTVFPYNTWIVLGVFWPPKGYQPVLFPYFAKK